MRLLGLTNHYPPLGYGYGAICRDVMRSLGDRGHEVAVLAADEPSPGSHRDGAIEVRRELDHVPAAWRRPVAGLRAEARNQAAVRRALSEGVDAAVVWHMRGICKGALTLLHDAGVPVVYMLGDLWVVYERPGPPLAWSAWQALDRVPPYRGLRHAAGRVAGLGRVRLDAPPIAQEGVVCFASAWLERRYAGLGFRPRTWHVVHNGVPLDGLLGAAPKAADGPLGAAFVGRVDATKGADTAVRAVAAVPGMRLEVAGSGADEAELKALAARLGAADRIRFHGLLERDAALDVLRRADIFVMPGRIEEAFGLVYVEAMAAGAAVVGSALGGAAEICHDGENALVVGPDDDDALTAALRRLDDDRELTRRLAAAGRETAAGYSLTAMMDRLETLIAAAAS